jgi:hypothetical protein
MHLKINTFLLCPKNFYNKNMQTAHVFQALPTISSIPMASSINNVYLRIYSLPDRVLENKVIRRIFGLKRDDGTGS